MITSSLKNRRSCLRLPVRLDLSLRLNVDKEKRSYQATCLDLHHTGARIRTDAPLAPGMRLLLLPRDPAFGDTDWVEGVVVWGLNTPLEASYGICFTNRSPWLDNLAPSSHLPPAARPFAAGDEKISEIVLDSLNDGVFSVDRKWRITSFNRAAENLTGWSRSQVIGKPCRKVFMASNCDDCVLAQSISRGEPVLNRSLFICTAAGKRIPVNVHCTPLKDDRGRTVGGVQVFRNVASLLGRALILDSIADGVFTVDRSWRITSFNRAAERMTGIPVAEAIGRYCSDVFQASICGETCAIAHSMCTGKPESNRSITIRGAGGKRLPVSICAAPLIDSEGNIAGGVESIRDLSIINSLRRKLSKYQVGDIISKSPAVRRIFDILPNIARSDSNVLVLGESGTGKELMAAAIHQKSPRRHFPFVAVNCGALPDTLLESELFGYKAGAFTDAKQDKEGRFAAAEGGTLFLDEIGDIPQSLQVKLLRVLQNKVYEPLGSNVSVKADVRIITATNRDLQQLVQEGVFREDLFYRLNVVKIHLPPLRERMEDLPILIDHFIKQYSAQQGKDIVGIANEALNILMRYDYPGNIRELENIIEYAFILCEGGFIQREHLPEPFAQSGRGEGGNGASESGKAPQTLEEIEKQAILLALERNKWKRMATCRELGISKDTLRRKINRYHLESPLEKDLAEIGEDDDDD